MTCKSQCGGFLRRLRWFVVCVVLLFCATAVVTEAEEATPWTHQDYADQSVEFQFAIVSDRAANPREGVFKAALGKLEILRPELVLSVGDFIHGYGEGFKPLTDEAIILKKRDNVDDALKQLSVPFYRVAGNHDYNNEVSAKVWKDRYGPAYYSFTYENVLFLCLNSQDGPNYGAGIGEDQIAWVKETLAQHGDARWVHLFFHQPLWLEDDKRMKKAEAAGKTPRLTGFGEVEKLLEGRDYTVFAGHHHNYGKWIRNGQKYLRLATTGGQSALGGLEKGQFDHVLWVTMTAEGPVFANLLLDGILDEDAKNNLPAPE
jgi:calcineurin-like phosphoesterase family protein